MEITVRCVGCSDRVFSFDPKPGKKEAVSDIVDHYMSQMLAMVMPEIDAIHDQQFQIYEYITTSYRRELMRHPGNAFFGAEGMNGPVLELPNNSSTDERSSHIALPPSRPESQPCRPPAAGRSETFQDVATHSKGIAMRQGGSRQLRFNQDLFRSAPLPDRPNGELPVEGCEAADVWRRASSYEHASQPSLFDFDEGSIDTQPRPQRVNACDLGHFIVDMKD
eukprot:TRINITY_DN4311_c0_g2_i1.p1 TRINITY_DN4311_c0_g2~~TRINITY_DN4311_c0_g2_i1.p1  ORF type:complete len:222 (-),score=38.74 TRINITY_DN4311_c0_g2_i1:120-785(-)